MCCWLFLLWIDDSIGERIDGTVMDRSDGAWMNGVDPQWGAKENEDDVERHG